MDRLTELRSEAGGSGSGDSTLDTTSPPSEAFMSANDNSSKYFSINDSTFDVSPIKDISLASTSADADRSIGDNDELISNLSPIGKKELLDSYKIGKQIEAANILSGGVDIFDDDNSFDGNELVIDDNTELEVSNPSEMLPVEEIAVPELAEPELAEPELVEPELAEPELAEPELAEPELAEPELAEPELAEPELAQPELAEPELAQPELAEPELAQPELVQPELAEPELAEPELAEPDNEEPELAVPELAEPELAQPELAIEQPVVNEAALAEAWANAANREMEVVLQIDGNNVNAIDIGNGLYLYRKDGLEELAAVQITNNNPLQGYKFLKVRYNAEGNLEVYEEIEVPVKDVPTKEGKSVDRNAPNVPIIDINKQICESKSKLDAKTKSLQQEPVPSTSRCENNIVVAGPSSEPKTEFNLNGKMIKFNETCKSPVIGSFTPMTYHSTPNKEGKPLTKTMVDFQLDPNRHSENVKKTIEVHTDNVKAKCSDILVKERDAVDNQKCSNSASSERGVSEKIKCIAKENEQHKPVVLNSNEGLIVSTTNTDTAGTTNLKSDTEYQNKNAKMIDNPELSNKETNAENCEGAEIQNVISSDNKKQSDIDLSKTNMVAPSSATCSQEENKVTQAMETSVITIDNKPKLEQVKSVDSNLDLNEAENGITENKTILVESAIPIISSSSTDQEKTTDKVENSDKFRMEPVKSAESVSTPFSDLDKNEKSLAENKTVVADTVIPGISSSFTDNVKTTEKVDGSVELVKSVDCVDMSISNLNKADKRLAENETIFMGTAIPSISSSITEKEKSKDIASQKIAGKEIEKKIEGKDAKNPTENSLTDKEKSKDIASQNIYVKEYENKIKDMEDKKPIENYVNEKKNDEKRNEEKIEASSVNVIPTSTEVKLAEKIPEADIAFPKSDDNIIDFPLESFADVSNTCTNLGNEESKEESITLYSIDTDESVSLITPSSNNKISLDKVVLPKVFTSISSLNDIRSDKSVVSESKPKELLAADKAKEKVISKVDNTITAQKKPNFTEIPKKPIDASSIKTSEDKVTEKAAPSFPLRNIPNREFKHSEQLIGTPTTKPCQPTTTAELKPSPTFAETVQKQLVKTIKDIRAKPISEQDGTSKVGGTQKSYEKPLQLVPKVETKSLEKITVTSGFFNAKAPEKKHVPLTKPTGNVIVTSSAPPLSVKQLEVSSTVNVHPLKPESHIPVVSIASKPNIKHIQSFKVEGVAKSISIVNQKEAGKNTEAKKLTITKVEARDSKEPIRKSTSNSKPVNNNHFVAVPFGKWTDEHRQEFLNKFKEVKAPANSNTNQIKNSNDLNRRDVLKKIDSQRAQTINNATAKAQEKPCLKTENVFSNKISTESEIKIVPKHEVDDNKTKNVLNKAVVKPENVPKSSISRTSSMKNLSHGKVSKPSPKGKTTVCKNEKTRGEKHVIEKTELSQQHLETVPRDKNTASCFMASLIDRTIEDMINRVVPGKQPDEVKRAAAVTSEPGSNAQVLSHDKPKPVAHKSVSLDYIEMKMNELHGIPFVERPPHELPKFPKSELKTYSKTKPVRDANSDDEVIEHEPITGDIDLNKRSVQLEISSQSHAYTNEVKELSKESPDEGKKAVDIITETDFDKFARRNSITYENCLTVNFDRKEQHNHTHKEKDPSAKFNLKQDVDRIEPKINKTMPHKQLLRQDIQTNKNQTAKLINVTASNNKKYQSKLHTAYQTAMTAKQQVSPPISIIEDKPVKVVFLDSSVGFVPSLLNVQGQELSPAKRSAKETDATTTDNDSLDSLIIEDNEVLNKHAELIDDNKQHDKAKIKHQRKQVLTPVEVPDLELIQPGDIGIENTTKKKRKLEDSRAKSILPKKSYLLDRNTTAEDKTQNSQTTKDIVKPNLPEHKNVASAIDNLVKAAELLENQEGLNKSISQSPSPGTPNTPVKRGRGRPRKNPLPEEAADNKTPSLQKKPRLIDAKPIKQDSISDEQDEDSSGEDMVRVNWTMGKINENIVCPICNKLFRSENVVFKHVKHCTGVSPSRSDSDKRSPRRSRLSQESEDTDMDYEVPISEIKKDSPKKRKPKESIITETSEQYKLDNKNDVIVIEEMPIKEKPEKPVKEKEDESKKISNAKPPTRNMSLVCEFCGKAFRQQSYLMSHKLLHKKEMAKKYEPNIPDSNRPEVFSCEVCKKQFRKLHHLVQHRLNHNPDSSPKRALRKSSAEQNDIKNVKVEAVSKQEDASAGFRCEPCDKSFRKLHHLVEHRGTHDNNQRHKPPAPSQPPEAKPTPPPTCEICNKTFRKLHHLIEHKETHADTNSAKSDERSIKSALSTKDIIHECSLCYMVFPNEHSLNKHSAICSKKKRQSKQPKDMAVNDLIKDEDVSEENKVEQAGNETKTVAMEVIDHDDNISKNNSSVATITEQLPEQENKNEVKIPTEIEVTPKTDKEIIEKTLNKNEANETTQTEVEIKRNDFSIQNTTSLNDSAVPILTKDKEENVVPEKIKNIDVTEIRALDVQKKRKSKEKSVTPKRPKSMEAPLPDADTVKPVESSDDDDIRYMFNPNFKPDETSPSKTFMKVRARKRNSLQIERPSSNDVAKRRTSLQHPPKISRLKTKHLEAKTKAIEPKLKVVEPKPKAVESKPKAAEAKPKASDLKTKVPELKPLEMKSKVDTKNSSLAAVKPKLLPKISEAEMVLSTDSDDSEVKYSFPETVAESSKATTLDKKVPRRRSQAEKRKSLGGIAKRKSVGKGISAKHKEVPSPVKPIKKRWAVVEHRCDCGQLFSSAAMLARHTSLAHTPPRIRRRRDLPDPAPEKPMKKTAKPDPPPKPAAKPAPAKTPPKTAASRKSTANKASTEPAQKRTTRRSAAHSGVPVPDKMRKLIDKELRKGRDPSWDLD